MLPVHPSTQAPNMVLSNSVFGRQLSSRSRRTSDFNNLLLGEFRSTPSPQVLNVSHRFKVVWPNTRWVATKVIKFQSFWNRTISALVGDAMRHAVSSKFSVSKASHRSLPNKARSGVTTITLFPQIFAPDSAGLQSRPMSPAESLWLPLAKVSELSTTTLAEFRRLRFHVGLLLRLTLGGRRDDRRSPYFIGAIT